MATLKPFRILAPKASKAEEICALPYDVMNTEEAREMAKDKPLSFLRVTRPEIELDENVDPYSDEVYQHGADNLKKMISEGHLVQEASPCYLVYKLVMGDHEQIGLVAGASCKEYDEGIVKKHEKTRPDKEDDRTRHINILGAQTGSVFLTYRSNPEVDELFLSETKNDPDIDFTAEDGIQHTGWFVRDPAKISAIEQAFAEKVPALYVADGHHRSAAASRVRAERMGANSNHTGEEPYNYFLTVTFPHDQVKILDYNRAVKDLNGLSEEEFMTKVKEVAEVSQTETASPSKAGECCMYLNGKWHKLVWKDSVKEGKDTVGGLDISILQDTVLNPLLGVQDPRTDKRIAFIGGIRGTKELKKVVDEGKFVVSFAMYPTSLVDLMTIADEGGLMPPKSTWFEPKLRDALAVHLIN